MLSRVLLFVTLWTIAYQAPLSVEFSRQEYWSGLPFSPPGGLPDPGIEPTSPACISTGRWISVGTGTGIGRWILYHLSHLESL